VPEGVASEPAVRLTPTQWLICAVACLGFAFDLYETLMLPLILRPALGALGHLQPGTPDFNFWVGLLFFVPSAVGGVLGLLGGYLTDRLGRRRVLVWSILLYGFAACAASQATSLPMLLLLRCATLAGVCVEYPAALAWLAELFPNPRQREAVLAITQAFFIVGGLMVTGAYFLAVTYAEQLPAIHGGHEAWRYTLLSGTLPALPLLLIRPFLPESPIWREKRLRGLLKRPSVTELFRPALRRTTLVAAVLVACTASWQYAAIQHTVRIVPGLPQVRNLAPRQVEQVASGVQLAQELGALTGRVIFILFIISVVSQRRRLRLLLLPGMFVFAWLYFFAATRSLSLVLCGVFIANLLFNGLHALWGNYLPRVYPTHLRGTGESFAINIGGRVLGSTSALFTTQLANVMPASGAPARLAYAAGTVALLACSIAWVASFWLTEPEGTELPE
jgi:hypothetical protein